jgi:hypothetical protein
VLFRLRICWRSVTKKGTLAAGDQVLRPGVDLGEDQKEAEELVGVARGCSLFFDVFPVYFSGGSAPFVRLRVDGRQRAANGLFVLRSRQQVVVGESEKHASQEPKR